MTGVLTGGSNWCRTWCGLQMTYWKRDWSADWNRSVNDGVCVGRNPYLTTLLIMACRWLHSDALRNPDQAGLAYCSCETRATFHLACAERPCSLIVFSVYIDLAAFPTASCTCEPKLNTWLNCTQRKLILSSLETSGIHGRLFVSLWYLEWKIISNDLFVLNLWLFCMAMQELMLNRLGIDRWNYLVNVIRVFGEMVSWINWVQIRGTANIRSWTQGRALYCTCINWLNGQSSAIELNLMLPVW